MAILLVEDDSLDAKMFKDTLAKLGVDDEVVWVTDGEHALDYLLSRKKFINAPSPDLVVLDLGLPRINGLQVLKAYAAADKTAVLPIVVFSTTDREEDKAEALLHGARACFTKPLRHDDYLPTLIRVLECRERRTT